MVTHIPLPTAYHIGKEGNIRESEINKERQIIIKLVMICARGFLAKFLMVAFVVFTPQPKFVHVFNTLRESPGLLADTALSDIAVRVASDNGHVLLDQISIFLQSFKKYLRI